MSPFAFAYLKLLRRTRLLNTRFITPHLPANPSTPPGVYELDVRAYCVLSHAAIEEYLEKVAIMLAQDSIDAWITRKRVGRSLLALVAFYDHQTEIEEDKSPVTTGCFDRLRVLLNKLTTAFSKDVFGNHGIAIKYLRRILYPVGIDVPTDANLINSLERLSTERGSYAHTDKAHQVLAPEDAQNYVNDVLELCGRVCRQAVDRAAEHK